MTVTHPGYLYIQIRICAMFFNMFQLEVPSKAKLKEEMCALNSHLLPSYGYLMDNAVSHERKELGKYSGNLESIFHFPSSPLQPETELDEPTTGGGSTSVPTIVAKKLNHNAKERDRRRQINTLFSSLRSLIPAADEVKNLTNPAIVSLALEYIPEIQQQVKTLLKKKDGFSRIKNCRQANDDDSPRKKQRKSSEPAVISTNQLNDNEITVQISTYQNIPLSDILFDLEEDGLELKNASSFGSYQGMVFYNLHLKVETSLGFQVSAEVLERIKNNLKRDASELKTI